MIVFTFQPLDVAIPVNDSPYPQCPNRLYAFLAPEPEAPTVDRFRYISFNASGDRHCPVADTDAEDMFPLKFDDKFFNTILRR